MKLPRAHTRHIDALGDLTDVNRWASDVDSRLKEIISSIQESNHRLVQATTPSSKSRIRLSAHAAQHLPGAFDALPTIAGITLDATTPDAVGTSKTFSRGDHSHQISTATPSGGYGVASLVGSGAGIMRASAVLSFPEALGTLADRTHRMTLGGTTAPIITFDGPWTANSIFTMRAPGQTTTGFAVGQFGNVGIGQAQPVDQYMLSFAKTDYDEGTITPIVFSVNMVNKGAAGIIGLDLTTVTASAASGACTNPAIGGRIASFGGASNNANFSGAVQGLKIACRATRNSAGAVGDMEGVIVFDSWPLVTSGSTRAQFTNVIGLHGKAPTNTLGSCTNNYGILIDSQSIGTNRWSIKGTQKFECAGSDFVASLAGKGLVIPDTQGTPEYWRHTIDATGLKDMTITVDALGVASFARGASATGTVIVKYVDTGTVAPAT